jgi:hypothetical protein
MYLNMNIVKMSAIEARRSMRSKAVMHVRHEFVGMTCIWFW